MASHHRWGQVNIACHVIDTHSEPSFLELKILKYGILSICDDVVSTPAPGPSARCLAVSYCDVICQRAAWYGLGIVLATSSNAYGTLGSRVKCHPMTWRVKCHPTSMTWRALPKQSLPHGRRISSFARQAVQVEKVETRVE